jgi:hypothetical protein
MKKHVGGKRDPEKEAHWRSVIKDWKASKLSGTAFCRQANIKVTTFYSWLKVIADRDKEVKSKSASEAVFVPVAVKPTTESARSPVENKLERVEIWLKSGSVIRAAATSPRALVELLDRLGENRC